MEIDSDNVIKVVLRLFWTFFKIFLICFFIVFSVLMIVGDIGIYGTIEVERFVSESPDGKYRIHIMDENLLILGMFYKSSIYIENVETGDMIRYYSTKYTGGKATYYSDVDLITYNNIKINWYDEYVDIVIEVIPFKDYDYEERVIPDGVITYRIDCDEVGFD